MAKLRKHEIEREGSLWDLSLLSIEELPFEELEKNGKKATRIDLSDNLIRTLPAKFPTFVHITWLDLSKNQLSELPEDFGSLVKLQHLDLYRNKLQTLPLSFKELKRLKFLDLHDNPLNSELKKAVGECRSAKDCEQCAIRTVKLLNEISVRLEDERRRRLKEEDEERKRQQLLEYKKRLEKEKKKAKLAKRKKKEIESKAASNAANLDEKAEVANETHSQTNITTNCRSFSLWRIFFFALLFIPLFLLLCFAINDYRNGNGNNVIAYLQEADFVKLLFEIIELLREMGLAFKSSEK